MVITFLSQKNNNCKLQQNLDVERKGFDDKLKRELEALKDQLKVCLIVLLGPSVS